MKNVFVRKDGQLEIGGCGRLASIEEVLEYTSMTGKVIQGLIQLKDTVYSWFDNSGDKESVEDVGEVTEYIRHDNIITLYAEFKNDVDEFVEEIINISSDENDVMLSVVTRGTNNNTIKLYNYYRNNGKIIKEDTTCHISMLSGLFVA